MKMGYATVENSHVQLVLFNLLDYCTDISQNNRAETLLEDALKLWLIALVSSRLATVSVSLFVPINVVPAKFDLHRAAVHRDFLTIFAALTNVTFLDGTIFEEYASPTRNDSARGSRA